ncbi:MAG: glycoside hydrolase family 2 TIM barrel-domain containing protein [Bacillota bacterium]
MRQEYNMNFDWRFHDGDIINPNFNTIHDVFENPVFMKSGNCGIGKVGYNLHKWDTVQVPHDFRHYRCEFDKDIPSAQGFLTVGIVWYRKEFFVDAKEEGKAITIEFDGVYRDSEVYVNGNYVGRHLSGYTSFSYDISDFILYGEDNAVAVRVDGTKYEGWWYEAMGIYRDVRLVIADRMKVKKDSVFVISTVEGNNADVKISLDIENESEKSGEVAVQFDILDQSGTVVVTKTETVSTEEYEECHVKTNFKIDDVKIWDIDDTNQYTAKISITHKGTTIDIFEQKFGVRTIEWSTEKGFILNGRPIKLQGVCIHDDFAGVGGAMSEAVIRHKVFLLKQMGCNAYRASHNPPSPYVLDACDEFGLLVMDEVRLMNTSNEYLKQMTDLIKRDRNHPSIFMWSIGNEEMGIHGTRTGVKIVNHMMRVSHKLDPTRLCTYANNSHWKSITQFHEENGLHIDVFGFNYNCLRHFDYYKDIHEKYPDRCIIGTENGSALSTRGQYLPREEELNPDYYSKKSDEVMIWSNPDRKFNVSAYGEAYTIWGATPMETMKACDLSYVTGYFLWTGFDYRGEVVPFDFPSVISRFGLMDLCGFMKDLAIHCQVKWAKEPAIHLYPHWTFDENVGELQVEMIANTEEVELFVNGKSLGKKANPQYETVMHMVPYEKGEIIAVGYIGGKEVVRMVNKTTTAPERVQVEILQDRDYIANGEDNVFVKIDVVDKDGVHCPNADNVLHFEVSGAGEFLGCGNGDPLSHENDMTPQRALFNGLALCILRTKRETGTMKLTVTSDGLIPVNIEIPVVKSATDLLVEAPKHEKMTAEALEKDAADGAF